MPEVIINGRFVTKEDYEKCDKCYGFGLICIECDEAWETCGCDDPVEGECLDCEPTVIRSHR